MLLSAQCDRDHAGKRRDTLAAVRDKFVHETKNHAPHTQLSQSWTYREDH
jgi:hypothetical protein